MTEKAYAAGSTVPPLAEDKLRLYSMRLCPYAQRTRLVLAHLNIPHEVVNINLAQKPEWFFTKNPLGLVPVLEKGDKIVYESTVCDEYLEDVYGNHGLLPADPYTKARIKILMESVSKITDKFYTLLRTKADDDKQPGIEELRKAAKFFEDNLSGTYFGGDKPSMLDFHIWPWFERFPMLERVVGTTLLPADQFPKLNAWVKVIQELPAVKSTFFDTNTHFEFVKPILAQGRGATVNYDIGLE